MIRLDLKSGRFCCNLAVRSQYNINNISFNHHCLQKCGFWTGFYSEIVENENEKLGKDYTYENVNILHSEYTEQIYNDFAYCESNLG